MPVPEQHLVALATAAVLQRRLRWVLPCATRTCRVVGWILVANGAGLIAVSAMTAGPVALPRPEHLVVRGPYAWIRNPMYAGWAALHLGAGLITGSGWMLAVLLPALQAVHRQVLTEEAALTESFGAAFVAYQANVPRYVPRRRLTRGALQPGPSSRVRPGV